jgi:hypothetical protein
VRDVLVVFLTAAKLLLRHWPALLTLALLGAAVRNAALYAAIRLSDVQGQLGQLMLVLAPLGYLLPVVAMLSICRRSLPALQAADAQEETAPTEGRQLRLLDVAVSVLVPFLAVYQSYGLLEADLFRFRNSAAADEFLQSWTIDPEDPEIAKRLGIYSVQVALLIVVGAWLLRWALGRMERTLKLTALAFAGAFVEVYYTAQLAGQFVVLKVKGVPWLQDRVAARWLEDAYDAVVDFLGPVSGAFRTLAHGVEAVAGSFDAVVVIPVAWLALAAVVLGYKLTDLEEPRAAASEGKPGLLRSLWSDLQERWSALVQGVRLLAVAGLAPMLVFSLVFLLVTRIPATVHDVARAIVGPQLFGTWVAINPYEVAIGFAVSLTLTAPMLAAAVDWLVRTRTARRSPASTAATTPAPG